MSEAGCREIRHRYTRRKKNHDYYGVGTYHIILKKRKACPVFGHVAGSAAIPPGMRLCPYCEVAVRRNYTDNDI